jgi:hypothetical protein
MRTSSTLQLEPSKWGMALVLNFEEGGQQGQLAAGKRQLQGRELHGPLFLGTWHPGKQGADGCSGGDPGALAVTAGGYLHSIGGKAQAHPSWRLQRKVERLCGGRWLAGLGVEGFEPALDAESTGLASGRGGQHVQEGHEHGLRLCPGLQRVRAVRGREERDESQGDAGGGGGTEKAR